MFRDKWLIVISLTAGLAVAAFFYAYSNGIFGGGSDKAEEETVVHEQKVMCVVASREISRQTQLTREMLEEVETPYSFAHPRAVQSIDSVIGRIAGETIFKGQMLLEPQLRSGDAESELSFILPEGKRAITIGATVTSAVGNMLVPGDYVDVIVYLGEKAAGKDVAFTLLRRMQILATDAKKEPDSEPGTIEKATGSARGDSEYRSVTLAAEPQECVKLNLAESIGIVKLVLHSTNDPESDSYNTEIASVDDLTENLAYKPAKAVPVRKNVSAKKSASRKKTTTEVKIERIEPEKVAEEEEMKNVYILRGTKMETLVVSNLKSREYAEKRGE